MSNVNHTTEALDPDINKPPVKLYGLILFYGLWVVLAMASAVLGHSTISLSSAMFLLAGIVSTNFFFLSLTYTESHTEDFARLLANYQTILGIAWISAYSYFSTGAGDLVLGMYLTILMFAVSNLDSRTVLKLSSGALFSYLLIMSIKVISSPAAVAPVPDTIRFMILLAICGSAYSFARRLGDLRNELQCRNEELQTIIEQVTHIAGEDHLTKSHNRRYIMEVLAREKSRTDRSGGIFAVLMFDLDDFKQINDQHGHLVGDQILSDFAASVKHELRGMDSLNSSKRKRSFGRYGGEEFIAVLPETRLVGAELCAERIRDRIEKQKFRMRYSITVSIGVSEYHEGETVPQLLSRTDQALYQAKHDGRNLVRCSTQPIKKKPVFTRPKLRVLR
jgi:diguanylate cyclase (GGDEF)-like protein